MGYSSSCTAPPFASPASNIPGALPEFPDAVFQSRANPPSSGEARSSSVPSAQSCSESCRRNSVKSGMLREVRLVSTQYSLLAEGARQSRPLRGGIYQYMNIAISVVSSLRSGSSLLDQSLVTSNNPENIETSTHAPDFANFP